MKRKINKKKVAIIIIGIIMLITLPTFGRYVYNTVRDAYLKSRNFSFTSNVLTTASKTYRYSNWSGVEPYELDFNLYSYENELSLFTYEGAGLGYNMTCTVDQDTKVSAHIDYTSGESTTNGYIPNNTNIRNVKIYLKPTGGLNPGDTIILTVTAETTVPYKKKLSAKFQINVTQELISYSIEDAEEDVHATFKMINAKKEANKITLSFNPELVIIDTSDECYINRDAQTVTEIDGIEYVNSVTITLAPESSKNITFYKKDKTQDYTYPGGSYGSLIITVTSAT